MKKRDLILTMALGVFVTLLSCKKDVENPISNPPTGTPIGNTENEVSKILEDYLESQKQHITVDVSNTYYFQGQKGTTFYLNGNNFEDGNGNPITGNVDFTLVENYSKVDMIMTNKVTLGAAGNGAGILVSGGEFYMEISQNGNFVEVVDPIQVLTAPTSTASPMSMQLFDGETDAEGNILWIENNDTITAVQDTTGMGGPSGTSLYSFAFNWYDSLSWINCDYFSDVTGPTTDVNLNVPAENDNTNTKIFMVLTNDNAVSSIYSYNSGVFSIGSYYGVPVGIDVSFVAISYVNNQLAYAIIPNAIITTNHTETFVTSDFTNVADAAALNAALSNYF